MTSTCSDADLLRRSLEGDRPAFGEIVVRYEGLVRALAYSACGDRAGSEDIAQEAFVTAWRRLRDLRDAGRFRPWLCSIARSAARLRLRHASRRPEGHAAALDGLPEIPDTVAAPDRILALREEERLVWEMLERLPLPCREVLVLHYREEHAAERIAEELGISNQAVRQRLARGRALLRDRLAHLVEDSLQRGRRSGGTCAVAALAALPAALPAKVSAASGFNSISTTIAAMTKLQAAAAGIVLAALAGAPFLIHQQNTIHSLRHQADAPAAAHSHSGKTLLTSPDTAGSEKTPHSLQDLRALLKDRPSRRHTAELWRQAERIPREELPALVLEALKLSGNDWRDKEITALLMERMAQLDPSGAAVLVARLDGGARITALTQLAAIAPAEALPLLAALKGADLARVLADTAALDRIAEHDPATTAGLLAGIPMNSSAAPLFARLAELWAARDPQKALTWAESLDFEQVRSQALMKLYPEWAKQDRTAAFAALARVPEGEFRRSIFDEMAWGLISNDLSHAETWVRSLEGNQRSYALGLLSAHVSTIDHNRGRALLEEAVSSGAARLSWPSEEVGRAWAQHDPAAAGKWAMTLPEGDIRQHAAEGVARTWVAADPVAASAWIATLPPGVARNGATYYLVEGISRSDPASAFRWAASITGDPEKRLYLLQRSVDSWTVTAPDAARAAIGNLTLSEGERESLIRRL
ncbi:MAG TPA: sigma-70 family RNA polymerase sigma factor [Verrucomicrobiales bacterium]|nr:sigma-70 family RNA polymerase sigma factor [Verrucomicrobiales bacterium]